MMILTVRGIVQQPDSQPKADNNRRGSEMVELVLKINEHEVNKECGLCGSSVNFRKGPQLFRADNWKLVCGCGGNHAPELHEIIPEVRDFLGHYAYLERMDRLRESEAKGEDFFPF